MCLLEWHVGVMLMLKDVTRGIFVMRVHHVFSSNKPLVKSHITLHN